MTACIAAFVAHSSSCGLVSAHWSFIILQGCGANREIWRAFIAYSWLHGHALVLWRPCCAVAVAVAELSYPALLLPYLFEPDEVGGARRRPCAADFVGFVQALR